MWHLQAPAVLSGPRKDAALSHTGTSLAVLSDFGAGSIEVTPAADTTYTITSTDDGGSVLTELFTVRVFPDSDSWRSSHFTEAELADPELEATLWGDDADPDGDGLSNCLEFLLQGNPRLASPELFPSTSVERIEGDRYVIHRYADPIATGQAAVFAENSVSLRSWKISDAPEIEEIERISIPGQVDRVTIRQLPAIRSNPATRMFYRVTLRKAP